MNTTIIGLGLIGGSIALDLRKANLATQLTGVDTCNENAMRAIELSIIDRVFPLETAIAEADLIISAIPVNALITLLPRILDLMNDSAVLIDTGSTKGYICKKVADHKKRPQYVAAHPIAGTENSGPDAAHHGLFKNKTNIICDHEKSSDKALHLASKVFDTLGLNTIYMNPEAHDKHVAYVSHLSHVSSFLLGKTVLDIEKDEKNIFNLAGSGFSSTVRLAKSSPDMWTPIFEQNSEFLSQAILEYIMHLQRFHYHLMKKDSQELHRIMAEANQIRRILDSQTEKETK